MDLLLKKLLDLLEEEKVLLESLLTVIQTEQKALVESNLELLNHSGKEKENLLLMIRILEEQRMRLMDRLGNFFGCPSENLTVNDLARMVQEPFSARFKESGRNLLALATSIQEANQTGKALMMHSLNMVRDSLALLNNLIDPNPVYHQSGRMHNNDSNGRIYSAII